MKHPYRQNRSPSRRVIPAWRPGAGAHPGSIHETTEIDDQHETDNPEGEHDETR